MTNREYVSYIWYFKVEDNLPWSFCAGIIEQDGIEKISPTQLEKNFKKYFKDNMGIAPYTKCPSCGNKLLPRKSKYGYFVGCSKYPDCKFMATDKKPYKKEDNKNE